MKKLIFALAATTAMTAPAMAEMLDLEKDELTFGFIKLTDMAPLAVAYEQGYFDVVKAGVVHIVRYPEPVYISPEGYVRGKAAKG